MKEHWKRDAPMMKLETRPSFKPQLMSEGAVMADAIKKLRPVVYPGQVFVERRGAEKDRRAQAVNRQSQSEQDQVQPKKEFEDQSRDSAANLVRAQSIEDRYAGEAAIKKSHRAEITEVDRRQDDAIQTLRDQDRETNDREWQEHRDRFEQLHKELRAEHNFPDREQQPGIQYDRFGNEIIDMSGPVEPEKPELGQNAPYPDPPPLEPDPPSYERETSWDRPERTHHERHAPEREHDWEIGD